MVKILAPKLAPELSNGYYLGYDHLLNQPLKLTSVFRCNYYDLLDHPLLYKQLLKDMGIPVLS